MTESVKPIRYISENSVQYFLSFIYRFITQSKIFQTFICCNFDDYDLQIIKTQTNFKKAFSMNKCYVMAYRIMEKTAHLTGAQKTVSGRATVATVVEVRPVTAGLLVRTPTLPSAVVVSLGKTLHPPCRPLPFALHKEDMP
ncbi:hypothetical protein ATANTOWER_028744 [Ataeniobius toweri]|uniref:Uncharacterized protein n=1 Tax=Ataeniobius toweri TaxID=208326 RepID=A0ABU7C463_9TELE|nr:hypothetical protein [Ataeniobius toweri]